MPPHVHSQASSHSVIHAELNLIRACCLFSNSKRSLQVDRRGGRGGVRGAGALSAKMGAAHVGVLGLLAMVQFACTSRPLALREHGAMRMPASLSSTGRRPGVLRLSGGAEVLNAAGALGLQESVRSEMGASSVAAAASCARDYLVRPRGQVRPPVQDSHHTAGQLVLCDAAGAEI